MRQPSGELSVRSTPSGQGLEDVVSWRGKTNPRDAKRMVVFVHGFANHEGKAKASYDRLFGGLRDAWPDRTEPEVWYFYWPGSARGLGFAVYPAQIEQAKASAHVLARFLRDREATHPRTEVVLVAHSLGCRLVLEALKLLDVPNLLRAPASRVTAVCLMAAAVPEAACRPKGVLGTRGESRPEVVLWSRRDLVLRLCFPPGQTAGGDGLLPRAVGYTGGPVGRWTAPARPSSSLGHGGYYVDYRSADEVSRLANPGLAPRSRTIPQRVLDDLPIRTPLQRIQERLQATRNVGGGPLRWQRATYRQHNQS